MGKELIEAVQANDLKRVRELAKGEAVSYKDADGWTPYCGQPIEAIWTLYNFC